MKSMSLKKRVLFSVVMAMLLSALSPPGGFLSIPTAKGAGATWTDISTTTGGFTEALDTNNRLQQGVNSSTLNIVNMRREDSAVWYRDNTTINDFDVYYKVMLTGVEYGTLDYKFTFGAMTEYVKTIRQHNIDNDDYACIMVARGNDDNHFRVYPVVRNDATGVAPNTTILLSCNVPYYIRFWEVANVFYVKVWTEWWLSPSTVVGASRSSSPASITARYEHVSTGIGFGSEGNYYSSGSIMKFQGTPPPGGAQITSVTSKDMMLWTCVKYYSNLTGDHKLEYDTDSGFGSVDGTLWAYSTSVPKFYIPQSEYGVNQTIYYRLTAPDSTQETGDFTYSVSPNDPVDVKVGFAQTQFKGGDYDPPNGTASRFVWIDPPTGKWTLKTGGGDNVKIWQSSDRGLHWTKVGPTLTVNTDYPSGWTHGGSWGGFEYDGSYYYLVLEGEDATGKGSYLYRGSSLSSLSYYGRLCYYGSGFVGLSKNCRARDIWYNETDGHLWLAIGGATDTLGAWDHVYKVCDTDDDLTIDDETGSSQTAEIYNVGDFGGGAWAKGFVYPYHQVWWDWDNERGMGVVPGCGTDVPDYNFDVDLVFPPSQIPADDISYFYMGSTATKGYYGQFFDTGQSKSVGMTDIYDTCLIWENNGAMFSTMAESATEGASDPDAGDLWLGVVRGYYEDTMIGVEPGYARINRYYELPTESQFRVDMLPFEVWTTETTNVTVDHLDGSAPVYASFDVYKTPTDVNVTVKIKNLTTDTCYLHGTENSGFWEYTITSSSSGAIATLTPAGSGDDFMFTFSQERLTSPAPTPDTVSIISGWDGYALYRDKDDWIKMWVLVGDVDGYDTITHVYLRFHLGEPEPIDPNYAWTYDVSAKEWDADHYGWSPFYVSNEFDDTLWNGYPVTNQIGVPFVFRIDPGCPITWNVNITGGGYDTSGNYTNGPPSYSGYTSYEVPVFHIIDSGTPPPGSSGSGTPGDTGDTGDEEPPLEPGDPGYEPPEWEDVYNCTLTYEEKVELYNELRYMTIRELRELCQDMDLDHQSWTIKEPYILLIFVDGYGCEPPGMDLDPNDVDDDGIPDDDEVDPWDANDRRRLGPEVLPGGEIVPPVFRFSWIQLNSSWIIALLFLLLLLMWLTRETEERDLIDIFKPLKDVK